jgi:ADP-ribose pyrophosphatase YjhB (NUDIX family)
MTYQPMDYTAGVIVLLAEGYIPMVYEERKNWKYPCGHKEGQESVEETACRELYEETGIIVKPEGLKLVVIENRRNHLFYLFTTRKYDARGYKFLGNDGEKNSIFSPSEILQKKNINHSHRRLTVRLLASLIDQVDLAKSA